MTVKPYSYTLTAAPRYVYVTSTGTRYTTPNPGCTDADIAQNPVTEAVLSFTPSPALPAVPQSASLALTPSAAALAAQVIPVDITVAVRREVSAAQYLRIPFML